MELILWRHAEAEDGKPGRNYALYLSATFPRVTPKVRAFLEEAA